ncbi:copper chaperone PCu(A)C [Amorphus sp. 3PC139-8]|uniref:copper chaperone PCu(A)C n=1 Tax=Amorphus sp. 3PC139-8 TaxID=2735676 RepID=UPI00345CB728
MIRAVAFAVLLVAATSFPAFAGDDDHDHDDDHHVSELGGVRAVHAWTRATSGETALVFVEIENGSDKPVAIEGGEADFAGSVDLVGFQLQGGEPGYVVLPEVPIQPGKELKLEPEGLALRLNGLTRPLHQGNEVEIEIEFDSGHMDVHVEVGAENAKAHSHAGHQH